MSDTINWGIIGTGYIAKLFAEGLKYAPNARLCSVGSRAMATAAAFANQFNVPNAYATYDELYADPDVDVVYVSTPHVFHQQNTLDALNAGKHVLCEKPLALNWQQVQTMVDAAQANDRFLMEAMWMWYMPSLIKAKELIDAGEIGEPRTITATFGFTQPYDVNGRFFNPALGGGALLDIGIYPLALAQYFFGVPNSISGHAIMSGTGVDEQHSAYLAYADGRIANLTTSIRSQLDCAAVIAGTDGYIHIPRNFWNSDKLTMFFHHKPVVEFDVPFEGNAYHYEALDVMNCIHAGKLQSDVVPWSASFDLINMMDVLRQQWGLVYPQEKK